MVAIRIFIIIALLLLASSVHAQDAKPVFIPASFPDAGKTLKDRLDFPDYEEDFQLVVKCQTMVSRQGRLDNNVVCAEDTELLGENLDRTVMVSSRGLDINPASIDGEQVDVLLHYSVVFLQQGDTRIIGVYPHHFIHVSEYGLTYSAPQLYEIPSLNLRYCRSTTSELSAFFTVVSSSVNKEGKPFEVENINTILSPQSNNTGIKRCVDHILRINEEAKYIPAIFDGNAIDALFTGLWEVNRSNSLFGGIAEMGFYNSPIDAGLDLGVKTESGN